MEIDQRDSSPVAIAFAWIIVLIPLSWGVYQSVIKSVPLFEPTTAPTAMPSPSKH